MLLCFCVSVCCISLTAQSNDPLQARVMAAVREAMKPALPFPDTDDSGAVPANNSTSALWMVRPLADGDRTIEVTANPLNEVNQARAAQAMAQIERAVEAAQRRSQLQYERAVAEAKRTGRSQDVDGITLADEGVAGARIDAESHVGISVAFNQPSYALRVPGSTEPTMSKQIVVPGAAAVLTVPPHVYRETPDRGDEERFAAAEWQVWFGVGDVAVKKVSANTFEATASELPGQSKPVRSLVLRFTGNETLIPEILRKTDWTTLAELLK